MKTLLITFLSFFLTNSAKIDKLHNGINGTFLTYLNTQVNEVLTKQELIAYYKKARYKLIYTKPHKTKNINNCFFIFEHNLENKNFKQNRILVVANLTSANKYKILYKLDDIIYDKNFTMTCYSGNKKEAFSKIVTKDYCITIEQNRCTQTKAEILHEFFTFKYNKKCNDYFLFKYSSVLEQTTIGDEFSLKYLTNRDFGKIKLANFRNEVFDKIKL